MNSVEYILFFAVVKSIISDHTETCLRNMDNPFLHEFTTSFVNSDAYICFMIIVIPGDFISLFGIF